MLIRYTEQPASTELKVGVFRRLAQQAQRSMSKSKFAAPMAHNFEEKVVSAKIGRNFSATGSG